MRLVSASLCSGFVTNADWEKGKRRLGPEQGADRGQDNARQPRSVFCVWQSGCRASSAQQGQRPRTVFSVLGAPRAPQGLPTARPWGGGGQLSRLLCLPHTTMGDLRTQQNAGPQAPVLAEADGWTELHRCWDEAAGRVHGPGDGSAIPAQLPWQLFYSTHVPWWSKAIWLFR